MEVTIEFHEVVEDISISFEEINVSVSFEETIDNVIVEITEAEEVNTIVFDELGSPGLNGKSNYQIAVDNGFVGTEVEWLDFQRNVDGGLIY